MIKIEQVSKRYGDKIVLDRVSLNIQDRDKLAIMGESGRGKTTLLRIIAGLEMADSGNLCGFDSGDIAYVFQEPRLFDWNDVLKNLTAVSSLSKKDAEARARELLACVGLAEDAHKFPSELSGGMKQRLSLARAFMVDRPILLLDEPFSALDQDTRKNMIAFVKEKAKDKTVLLVTHDANDANLLCDKTLYLE